MNLDCALPSYEVLTVSRPKPIAYKVVHLTDHINSTPMALCKSVYKCGEPANLDFYQTDLHIVVATYVKSKLHISATLYLHTYLQILTAKLLMQINLLGHLLTITCTINQLVYYNPPKLMR